MYFVKGIEKPTDGNSWAKFHSKRHFLIKNFIESLWGFSLHMIPFSLHMISIAFHDAVPSMQFPHTSQFSQIRTAPEYYKWANIHGSQQSCIIFPFGLRILLVRHCRGEAWGEEAIQKHSPSAPVKLPVGM